MNEQMFQTKAEETKKQAGHCGHSSHMKWMTGLGIAALLAGVASYFAPSASWLQSVPGFLGGALFLLCPLMMGGMMYGMMRLNKNNAMEGKNSCCKKTDQ
jgi:hypothetical protein